MMETGGTPIPRGAGHEETGGTPIPRGTEHEGDRRDACPTGAFDSALFRAAGVLTEN
jgi:hypothetical protein